MISAIVAVKDWPNIYKAVPSWLKTSLIDEIVIVDWDSKDKVEFDDDKIRVVRVEDQPKWMLSHAYNYAASLATGDMLLKLDGDYHLHPNFVMHHLFCMPKSLVQGQTFFTGDWKKKPHYNGLIFVCKEDFDSVGGYNERVTTWGYDDGDLYLRLVNKGLERLGISYEYIEHLHHQNGQSVQHQDINIGQMHSSNTHNKQICEEQQWSAQDVKWFEQDANS